MTDLQQILEKLTGKLSGWVESTLLMLPNLVVALLVLILFMLLSWGVRRLVRRVLLRFGHHQPVARLITTLVAWTVIATGFLVALEVLHLDKALSSLLAGAGIAGLAIGFAFQDLISNFISGIFISIKRPYKPGDIIEAKGHRGTVSRVDLRTTTIRLFEGQDVIIPNRELFQGILTNYSTGMRRIDIPVGVSYGESLEKVEAVTLDAISSIEGIMAEPAPRVIFTGFDDSAISLEAQYWMDTGAQANFLFLRSQGIKAIKAAYNQHDITIPFPIRTLDFGIKGGEKLHQMWTPQTQPHAN